MHGRVDRHAGRALNCGSVLVQGVERLAARRALIAPSQAATATRSVPPCRARIGAPNPCPNLACSTWTVCCFPRPSDTSLHLPGCLRPCADRLGLPQPVSGRALAAATMNAAGAVRNSSRQPFEQKNQLRPSSHFSVTARSRSTAIPQTGSVAIVRSSLN